MSIASDGRIWTLVMEHGTEVSLFQMNGSLEFLCDGSLLHKI